MAPAGVWHMPCYIPPGGLAHRPTGDTRVPTEAMHTDVHGNFREETRVNPSIYQQLAHYLIDFFHEKQCRSCIDCPEKLPDIGAVDGP